NLWTMMRLTFSISPKKNALCGGLWVGFPAVDLSEHCFHFGLAQFVFGIPPVESAQRFVHRIIRQPCFGDQSQSQLMNEPRVGSRIARRLDCFLAPLQKTLRVCECAFFLRMSAGRKEKDFGLDLFRS